jgi:hypothetical protein
MDIRFVSSLTPEDESRVASLLCVAIAAMLDELAIAYTLRIEATDGRIFQRCSVLETAQPGAELMPASAPGPVTES